MAPEAVKPAWTTIESQLENLRQRRAAIELGGGKERIESSMPRASSPPGNASTNWSMRRASRRSGSSPGIARRISAWQQRGPGRRSVTGCATVDGRPCIWPARTSPCWAARPARCTAQDRRHDAAVAQDGQPIHLHQRFRRGAGAGRNRQPRRLCARLLQQRHAVRYGSADLDYLWTLRRRRGLQSGAYRFHHPDATARKCSLPARRSSSR